MNSQSILESVKNSFDKSTVGVVVIVSAVLVLVNFLLSLILVVSIKANARKVRLAYCLTGGSIVLFTASVLLFASDALNFRIVLSVLFAFSGFVTILFLPLLFIREKIKVKKQHKNLIDVLDRTLKSQNDEPEFVPQIIKNFNRHDENEKTIQMTTEQHISMPEIDFTHVHNVINRLDYYGLSQTDKNQVKDLSSALFEAENNGLTVETKTRINDGLGALLKIMSKYNV